MQKKPPILFTYLHTMIKSKDDDDLASKFALPGYCPPHHYNHLALAFWTSKAGPENMCQIWQNADKYFTSGKFGQTKDQIQKTLKVIYNSAGIKLFVSAFGGVDKPTTDKVDPKECARNLAKFAKENYLDGIDVNYEDGKAFRAGEAVEWLGRFQMELRGAVGPGFLISHAPEAPYFQEESYKGGGYMGLHRKVGDTIDFYNIQFYNQGPKTYDTYEMLFEKTTYNTRVSVKEIIERGVPKQKVVLGKPSEKKAATNTGFVEAELLGQWVKTAKNKLNWETGLMTWKYSFDREGVFIKIAAQGLLN